MSVNTMNIEQAYTLIANLHEQATGQKTTTPTDLSSFISVAQSTLQNGYDPVMNAISQVIGKTIVAVRDYNRKFGGLEWTAEKWGAIIRKISFADTPAQASPVFNLVDGQAVDKYVVKKPNVLETRYVGSAIWEGQYTIFETQLDVAFSNPAEFASFMSGLMVHFSNEREQWFEEVARSAVANFIGAKVAMGQDVVHLLTEYNADTGINPPLTATTVKQPANYPAFIKWVYARIARISREMTERSQLYQVVITGKPIMRHTPVADQRFYLDADLMGHIEAEVLSSAFNDSFLNMPENERIGYWQAIDDPNTIKVTPTYIDNTGAVVVGTATVANDVVGVIFDRDAIGYNVYMDRLDTTELNQKGLFYNMFSHLRAQFQNDFTEKGVVLLLD